jgi:hypothetical protein
MAMTMKNAVFWDVTLCDSCKNRRFEERIASIIRVIRIGKLGTRRAVTSDRTTLLRHTNASNTNISSQRASVASFCYPCS